MVYGENSVNAQNLVPVELKKEHVNVTALHQKMVEHLALVHHQSQEVAILKNVLVNSPLNSNFYDRIELV